MTSEKTDDGIGERVVAISGDHVTRTGDIDELHGGEPLAETLRALRAHEITHAASDQHEWHTVVDDPRHGPMQPIGVGHLRGPHEIGRAHV